MYRLLVVDDEEFITDSLSYLLENTKRFELDVSRAYSAPEALEQLNRFSFDIVVTDIQMPGMSGVDLLKEINKKWPFCQVIFLTGHDDFEYAQQAIQHGVIRYVLKNEGDEVLLSAIDDSIAIINQEVYNSELIAKACEEIGACKPLLRRNYLQRLLSVENTDTESMGNEFKRLEIKLDYSRPVMLLVALTHTCMMDEMLAAIDSIVSEKIGHAVISEIGWTDYRAVSWILQPVDPLNPEYALATIKGMAENIKRTCSAMLKISVTFVLSEEQTNWADIANRFTTLRHTIDSRLEKDSDIAMVSLEYFLAEHEIGGDSVYYKDLLDELSDGMSTNSKEAVELYSQKISERFSESAKSVHSLSVLKLNTELSLLLLSYVSRHDLQEAFWSDESFRAFVNNSIGRDICTQIDTFKNLAIRMLELCIQEQYKSSSAFVDRLMNYMTAHLDSNLSLGVLSNKVYLNPSYLSRRFKELTGRTLSETIVQMRMTAACRMLEESQQKIIKVAALVGYESATHFSKVFKGNIGMTPQEYRDKKAILK